MKGSQASDDATGSLGPGRLQLPAMRVLVAPDCYGDSLSAVEAAAAIATGWTRSRPGDSFIVAPQSDKRSDQALAKLSSDAFRKQFSQVEVTSIDKIVYWSQYQAQVLFTMQVTPAAGGPPRGQVQGIAQLLFQRGQVLVCSYVLRTAGSY